MRVTRKSCAPRVVTRRIASMLAVSLLTALFAVVGPLSNPSSAAPATWDGNELTYEGNQYVREQPNPLRVGDPRDRAGEVAYTWIETLPNGDQKAHTLFFENDRDFFNQTTQLRGQETATLVVYDFTPPSNYSNPSPPEEVITTINLTGAQADDSEDGAGSSRCSGGAFGGMGWFLCSMSNWLSTAVDGFYTIVKQFLEVAPIDSDDESGLYDLWSVMRTIANVAFVIAFLVIIYSQITSIGISAYNIKAMIPRLIIAAILVNISYWICAIAIDASNLLGVSIQGVFDNIRQNISLEGIEDLSWEGITSYILAGGGVGIAGVTFVLSPVGGGSLGALGFLILSALISAAFALFVAFVILAARQAIITVLVVISPLALVAYILPNTEQYFKKWRESLTTLLVFFPVFSLLFGGSQLAGIAISQRGVQTEAISLVILGLAVQVVPLVITPLLLKFSKGLLGQIGNAVNGAVAKPRDTLKGWARTGAEQQAAKKRAETAEKLANGTASRLTRISPAALGVKADQFKRRREANKAEDETSLANRAEEERLRRLTAADANAPGKLRGAAERSRARHRERMQSAVDLSETSSRFKSGIEGVGKKNAAARLDALDEYGNQNKLYDEALHASAIEAVATDQAAEIMQGRFNAIVQELQAGENGYMAEAYDDLNDELKTRLRGKEATDMAEKIHNLHFETTQQDKRKSHADGVYKQKETNLLKADDLTEEKKHLKYAGGIDELGQHKVLARANSEAGALHMENVKAYDSVYSNEAYSVQEMMDVAKTDGNGNMIGRMRDGSKPSELQVHAAIQRVFTKVGNNWSAQKMADMVAQQGMKLNDQGLYVDSKGDVVGTGTVNDVEVTRRRELQQILHDSIQQSKLQIKYISNTEQAKMEAGEFMSTPGSTRSEELIIYDTQQGKYDPNRMATADPDELARMVQVYRDEEKRKLLTPSERANIVSSITEAQSNPNLKGLIKDRERGIMNILASYLDDTEPAERSAKSKENYYYVYPTTDPNHEMYNVRVSPAEYPDAIEKQVSVRVPNEYDPTRQIDYVSGAGLHDISVPKDEQPRWPNDYDPHSG